MRMTSSERSFRLWAFSVLSARIWKATSSSGSTSATMVFMPSSVMAPSRWLPLGVQYSPVLAHRDDRVEEAAHPLHGVGELLHVRRAAIALVGRRLDLVDGQRQHHDRCPPNGSL